MHRLVRTPLAALCATLVGVAALGACSSDPDPNKPSSKGALSVAEGECLFVEDGLGAQVAKLPVIDCTKAHTHEIFARVQDATDQVYPGQASLEATAEKQCYGAFEGYVGISPFDSSLYITWIVPSLGSWNDKDDRTILCVLGRQDGGQMDRSAKQLKI